MLVENCEASPSFHRQISSVQVDGKIRSCISGPQSFLIARVNSSLILTRVIQESRMCMHVLSHACMCCHMRACVVTCVHVLSHACMCCHMRACVVTCVRACTSDSCITRVASVSNDYEMMHEEASQLINRLL